MNTNESAGVHGWAQRAANNEDALCEKKVFAGICDRETYGIADKRGVSTIDERELNYP
jgi:hypothetical protein